MPRNTFIDPDPLDADDFDPYSYTETGHRGQVPPTEEELVPPTPSPVEGNTFKWHNRQSSLSPWPGRGRGSYRRTSSPLSGSHSRSQSPHTFQGSSLSNSHSSTFPFPLAQPTNAHHAPWRGQPSNSNLGRRSGLSSAISAHRPTSSPQQSHFRRHSGSSSGFPSTPQSSKIDSDSVYFVQDPLADFRENQLEMMSNMFYLMKRVDSLYGEVSWLRQTVGMDTRHQGVADMCTSSASNDATTLVNFHLHQPDFANAMGYSAERPNEYPPSILWNYDECKTETEKPVIFTAGNDGRPTMERALRDENGDFLSSDAYNRIKASVRAVAAQLLQLPGNVEARTKREIKATNPQAWTNALGMLEYMQPIVGLCSAHWKADHLIAQQLRNITRSEDNERKHKRRRTTSQGEQSPQGNSKPSSAKKMRSSVPKMQDQSSADPANPSPPVPRPTSQSKKAFATTSMQTLAKPSTNAAPRVEPPPHGPQSRTTEEREMDLLSGNLKKRFDIDFINVNPSSDNLEDIITNEYDGIQYAATVNLLKSMTLDTSRSFGGGATAPDVESLICRIESADPNTETDEDNLGSQWGHKQFANWKTPLRSWNAIGSPETACRLIAAVIKTAKVSRQLCQLAGGSPAGCLADCYLQEMGEVLWDLWKKSDAPTFKGKSTSDPRKGTGGNDDENTPDTGSGHTPDMREGTGIDSARLGTGGEGNDSARLGTGGEGNNSSIQPPDAGGASNVDAPASTSSVISMATKLTKKDLAQFITTHQMASPNKSVSKEKLTHIIAARLIAEPALQVPFDNLVESCKQTKNAQRSKKN